MGKPSLENNQFAPGKGNRIFQKLYAAGVSPLRTRRGKAARLIRDGNRSW